MPSKEKVSIVWNEKEVLVEVSSNWREEIETRKFLPAKSALGAEFLINLSLVTHIVPVDDTMWETWKYQAQQVKKTQVNLDNQNNVAAN